MYKVETHNNSREYYEKLNIEDDAVYITANTSLSNMMIEVRNVGLADRWRIVDIENFISSMYPNWNDTVNEIKLRGELRKALYEVKKEVSDEAYLKELKFLEENLSTVYSDFRYLVEAGVRKLTYDTMDIKLKLIKEIFNKYVNGELFKKVSGEVLNILNVKNFPGEAIKNYITQLSRTDENKAKETKTLIEKNYKEINKIYFYNISYLDLKRFMIAEILNVAGYEVVFRIPYFENFNVVNKCWDTIYKDSDLFEISLNQQYSKPRKENLKYLSFLEGREVVDGEKEKVAIKNYREVYDFKKNVKHKRVITLYKDSLQSIMERQNLNIKDHCYQSAIGRFLANLYNCEVSEEGIKIDFSTYRELITSGWIEYRNWNGVRLHSYLVDNEEYFSGVSTLDEIIERIEKLKDIGEVSEIFLEENKDKIKKNQTKEFLSNPFKAFGYVNVEKYDITANYMLEVTLRLKRFLLKAFEGEEGIINVKEHFELLTLLFRNTYIVELYKTGSELQKKITKKIFALLNNPQNFGEKLHKEELAELFNVYLTLDTSNKDNEQEDDFSIDQLEGLIYRGKNERLYLGDMSYKAYEKYIEKYILAEKVFSVKELRFIFEEVLVGRSKEIVLNGLKLQEKSRNTGESYLKFTLANLFINYDGDIEFSWIEGLRNNDSKAILLKQIEAIYGKSQDVPQLLDFNEFVDEDDMEDIGTYTYDKKDIKDRGRSVPEVALRDLDFCGEKFLYSSILEGYPSYYSDFQHRLAFSALVSMFKNNIEDGYSNMYKFVLPLFPQWQDVVKKNILDCEFSRNGLREYRYFEGINYPKSSDALYLLKSKYIVTENNKIRNRYNKGEFNGDRYFKEFVDEYLKDEQTNNGLHCKMCPHNYLCKKGDFVIDSK